MAVALELDVAVLLAVVDELLLHPAMARHAATGRAAAMTALRALLPAPRLALPRLPRGTEIINHLVS
jgi:hypothetical protein